jgi:DNA-binding PadR family transcriptional regulator
MKSTANWALLGLIIDRPSYGYELAKRFERIYEHSLTFSDLAHTYHALAALKQRGLVEELPGTHTAGQPKPHYQATSQGIQAYDEWLMGQVAIERTQQKIFVLQLTARTRSLERAMEVLDQYEQACLTDTCSTPLTNGEDHGAPENGAELQARLLAEQKRLAVGMQIAWTKFARREIKALAQARGCKL